MSQYVTIDYRKETIARIANIEGIRENLIDAIAELEEVKKRDPNSKTKSIAEMKLASSSKNTSHPSIVLSAKQYYLELQISEFKTIINDFEKGWRLLDELERKIIELRFIRGMSRKTVAKELGYSEENIKKKQTNALRIMENNILRI